MWSDTSWTPPEKFGMVEPGLYRSAFPTTASHEYLKLLGLRTVVNLSQVRHHPFVFFRCPVFMA